ncbi:YlbF family regulator [Bacillus sp. PS06]|uniref:YlbF family regulator n=1 Tax=Bacillus sp. PS06 TaxID=2764176 RepID=UPI0017803984|nr:YlbF family regulator [Bacillus sp. PS06]MBD8068414.1 YlbF family regulator [Bacillus sp. PS06]
MLATLERLEILDVSEEIANMILQSELMDEYNRSLYTLRHDPEAQKMIAHFTKMKDKYEEVQRFGKYHPDYRAVTLETRELKRKLDLNETIAAFKKAEQEIQNLLDELSRMVGSAVSEQIKVPSGNPYFDSLSTCSGGCGSGGSCGCS